MIIFVGDEPSRLNKSPHVAFIGSKSEPRLQEWINRLSPTEQVYVSNSHTDELLLRIMYWSMRGGKVIALGNKASKRLSECNVSHFKLPHPSPRNRKLNDPNFIDSELKKCQTYLRGKNETGN